MCLKYIELRIPKNLNYFFVFIHDQVFIRITLKNHQQNRAAEIEIGLPEENR